jgi:hypothetical protein
VTPITVAADTAGTPISDISARHGVAMVPQHTAALTNTGLLVAFPAFRSAAGQH